VSEHLIVDAPTLTAHRIDREPVIFCRPSDYRVGGQDQAPGLFGLSFQVMGAESPFAGVDEPALERVDGFTLVELTGDLTPAVRIGQLPASVDGAADGTVFLERRRERTLAVALVAVDVQE
jgi:hypothetical protein